MKIKEGGVMDIQELIDFKYEEIEGLKLNLSEDHHMNPEQEDELEELIAQAIKFGELCAKRDAKAQAVPEGFVLVEKAKIKTWFQDDDEPESFCSEESEIADLADPYETGEIIKINRIEDCVISVTPLYGTWKIDRIDQEGDVHRSFVLCDSYYEAEKVIVSNKEVDDEWLLAQQAQEPAND